MLNSWDFWLLMVGLVVGGLLGVTTVVVVLAFSRVGAKSHVSPAVSKPEPNRSGRLKSYYLPVPTNVSYKKPEGEVRLTRHDSEYDQSRVNRTRFAKLDDSAPKRSEQ